MATKTRRRLCESERDERRRADRERLQRAAEQLLSSEGWERWVRVRSRNGLARYSVNNQLLIAFARPDATFVAGFRPYLELEVSESDDPLRVFCELDNETLLDISIGDEAIPDAPVAVPESDWVVSCRAPAAAISPRCISRPPSISGSSPTGCVISSTRSRRASTRS